jgi:hypothetical protein
LSPANAAKIGSASDPTRAIASKDFFTWAGKSFASVFCHFNSSRSLVRIYESNLPEIIEYVLKINAGSFSFEAANPRHEHEYHLFERMKIPEGKVLCPGVVTHAGNIVEHCELIAERLIRFANLIGRRKSSDAVATSQADYPPRSGRAVQHQRWDRGWGPHTAGLGQLSPPSKSQWWWMSQRQYVLDSGRLRTIRGDSCPARLATKVIGFARTVGVSSIRASSIRAIAIMTNAVETNRILGLSAKLVCDTSFSSELY